MSYVQMKCVLIDSQCIISIALGERERERTVLQVSDYFRCRMKCIYNEAGGLWNDWMFRFVSVSV